MIDRKKLKEARQAIRKLAFTPLTPEAQAAAAAPPPGAPMDPAMMGGAPPMDPAMMDPAMMDPAMMDPAMTGGPPPPADNMVQVNMDDLKALMEEVVGEGTTKRKRATNNQILDKLEELQGMLEVITGPAVPQAEIGSVPPGEAGEAPPDDIAAMLSSITGGGGAPPPIAPPPPPGMPVQASGKNKLVDLVKSLKEAR